jgi:gas vesicle protein
MKLEDSLRMADDTNEKIIWFAAGAALGAAVALLYAPKTGADTRKMLTDKSGEGRAAIVETGKELYDRGKDLLDKGRQIADDAANLFEQGRKLTQG